jgi:hypothetical protein
MARRPWLALALVPLVSGCGPSAEEVVAAIEIAGPAILVVTSLILVGLAALHRGHARVQVSWRPTLAVLAFAVVLCVVGAVGQGGGPDRLANALFAFLLVGNMYLAATLLVWRVWAVFRPDGAFTWVQLPLAAILLAPAVVLPAEVAYVGYASVALVGVYAWPVTLVLFLGLLIEQIVRRVRARRRHRWSASRPQP